MKKTLTFLALIFVLSVPANSLAQGPKWGFVDGQRLIGLHPLMRQYDPQTRRFVNTVSQPRPSEDPAEYISRLQGSLDRMTTTLSQLDANYAGKINNRGMAARKAWWTFWKKRESLRIYQNLIREAINQAAIHGNFYLNFPSDWTMMPVAIAISGSINDACEYLRSSNKLEAIYDISVFSSRLDQKSSLNMIPNPHWKIWGGYPLESGDLATIGDSIGASLRRAFPKLRNRPFVAGAMDLKDLSESLLKDITLPTADLPGNEQ